MNKISVGMNKISVRGSKRTKDTASRNFNTGWPGRRLSLLRRQRERDEKLGDVTLWHPMVGMTPSAGREKKGSL